MLKSHFWHFREVSVFVRNLITECIDKHLRSKKSCNKRTETTAEFASTLLLTIKSEALFDGAHARTRLEGILWKIWTKNRRQKNKLQLNTVPHWHTMLSTLGWSQHFWRISKMPAKYSGQTSARVRTLLVALAIKTRSCSQAVSLKLQTTTKLVSSFNCLSLIWRDSCCFSMFSFEI